MDPSNAQTFVVQRYYTQQTYGHTDSAQTLHTTGDVPAKSNDLQVLLGDI